MGVLSWQQTGGEDELIGPNLQEVTVLVLTGTGGVRTFVYMPVTQMTLVLILLEGSNPQNKGQIGSMWIYLVFFIFICTLYVYIEIYIFHTNTDRYCLGCTPNFTNSQIIIMSSSLSIVRAQGYILQRYTLLQLNLDSKTCHIWVE